MQKEIQKERCRLEQLYQETQAHLSTLPEGHLIHSHDGNRYKFYQKINDKRIYLPKKNRALIKELALKRFLTAQLEDLSQEIHALDAYLRRHRTEPSNVSQLLARFPFYHELLDDYYQPIHQELASWSKEAFPHNPRFPEHLIHKSISGNLLRSKSEALIDMLLYTNKIPYRYESALTLGETIFYPDFTIRHPVTGNFFYWEHFGLMDDAKYRRNICSKLQLYMDHGIIPSLQLITTYETKDMPLTTDKILQIIEHYFS